MKSKSFESSRRTGKIVTYAALAAGSIIMVFPFVWMVLTSFKT